MDLGYKYYIMAFGLILIVCGSLIFVSILETSSKERVELARIAASANQYQGGGK